MQMDDETAPGTPTQPIAVKSTDGKFLVREDEDIVYDDAGRAFDAHSGQPLELDLDDTLSLRSPPAASAPQGKSFKARPLPSSTKTATIQPRLSKAAALRMGVALPEAPRRATSTASSSEGPLGISGLPRSTVEVPKSLQAPSIAPRLNRAAAARTKGELDDLPGEAKKERKAVDFSNTPGHKRQSLQPSQVASLAAPTVTPRLNKAATARLSEKAAAASGASFAPESISSRSSSSAPYSPARKPVDFSNTPGHKRTSVGGSNLIKSLQAPTVVPRSNRVSQGRLSTASSVVSPVQRTAGENSRTSTSSSVNGKENRPRQQVDYSNTPGHKRSMTGGAIASLAQPTIAPRINTATMKRLSMGGNMQGRPSLNGPMKSSQTDSVPAASALRASVHSNRPSSRSSMSGAHQDGPTVPRSSLRTSAAPPSSFRLR